MVGESSGGHRASDGTMMSGDIGSQGLSATRSRLKHRTADNQQSRLLIIVYSTHRM
jgi:hypothetical protein